RSAPTHRAHLERWKPTIESELGSFLSGFNKNRKRPKREKQSEKEGEKRGESRKITENRKNTENRENKEE
ncbi:hypothetical protein POVCU2_0042110, partial [Plasmodium ovale curtisi]